MNAINCGVTDTPDMIFVLPTPPLIERIARRLLGLGFVPLNHAEFVEDSIAEMDLPDEDTVLVWESASDAAPRNHCDFLCLLEGEASCLFFFSLRLRLSATLHPERLVDEVDVTTTVQTYSPRHEPPYATERLTYTVTPNTWSKYEADVLLGRLLARAY